MRRPERHADAVEQFRTAFEGMQAQLWTALPGRIDAVDLNLGGADYPMTAKVTPLLQALFTAADGTQTWLTLPQLVDCPIIFPNGGGFSLTFPVKAGDECLIIFASRCIDNWLVKGGVQRQAELRMHDLSDGFVLVGARSKPRALPSVSTTDVQLRSDDGTAFLSIDASKNIHAVTPGDVDVQAGGDIISQSQNLSATATGQIAMTAPHIFLTGAVEIIGTLEVDGAVIDVTDLNVNGNLTVTGALVQGGKNVGALHEHTGVTTGGGNTGGVL